MYGLLTCRSSVGFEKNSVMGGAWTLPFEAIRHAALRIWI